MLRDHYPYLVSAKIYYSVVHVFLSLSYYKDFILHRVIVSGVDKKNTLQWPLVIRVPFPIQEEKRVWTSDAGYKIKT